MRGFASAVLDISVATIVVLFGAAVLFVIGFGMAWGFAILFGTETFLLGGFVGCCIWYALALSVTGGSP